jgi:hypothetical protein
MPRSLSIAHGVWVPAFVGTTSFLLDELAQLFQP